jgi:hypothetical protein
MKLVHEDEYGAYLGVTATFLQEFTLVESNPSFEVFDSRDSSRRFITVKSSRMPDDEDLKAGRYGIDFNRAKPTLQEALQYGDELPDALKNMKWLANIAFAAQNEAEYFNKASVWENFYSYIWDSKPQTVWVAPHSGSVDRPPDDILAFPKLMIDASTAGVAASCAFRDNNVVRKRNMIAVHSTGQLGAVLNLGDFGILDQAEMDVVAENMELKYHKKAQVLADEFKQQFSYITLKMLENIKNVRGTLNPEELSATASDDGFRIDMFVKCLGLYGQEIKEFTLGEFTKVLGSLGKIEVPVILNNFIYPARNVSRLLKLSDKIEEGLVHSALQIEGAKLYMARDPELVTDIILDVKKGLFDD